MHSATRLRSRSRCTTSQELRFVPRRFCSNFRRGGASIQMLWVLLLRYLFVYYKWLYLSHKRTKCSFPDCLFGIATTWKQIAFSATWGLGKFVCYPLIDDQRPFIKSCLELILWLIESIGWGALFTLKNCRLHWWCPLNDEVLLLLHTKNV